jgi:hypothetical protein
VDITAGLDWKRVFGLHLWFSGLVDAPISQVFDAYNQLVKGSSTRKIAGPIPWYEETSTASKWRWKLPSPPSAPDALFSLIRLHAEPSCSLSHVLTPLSFGPSPLDYSLPWHLYIILSRCMRVRDFADRGDPGIRRTSPSSHDDAEETGVEGHSPSADLLTSSYAFQLEQQGMIQEAVFVLLHLEGSAGCVHFCSAIRPYSLHIDGRRRSRIFLLDVLHDWTIGQPVGSLGVSESRWPGYRKLRSAFRNHHCIASLLYLGYLRPRLQQSI